MQKGWYANGFVAYQPFLIQSSDPGNLLDGVQPLLLGGLLGFKLGFLLRIGFDRDLRVKLGELRVELLLEGGLAGVGFRIGLLPRGILDSLDLLVDGVEAALDAAYFVAWHIADLIPLLSLIHISEPTRLGMISYAVFCLKKKIKSK